MGENTTLSSISLSLSLSLSILLHSFGLATVAGTTVNNLEQAFHEAEQQWSESRVIFVLCSYARFDTVETILSLCHLRHLREAGKEKRGGKEEGGDRERVSQNTKDLCLFPFQV